MRFLKQLLSNKKKALRKSDIVGVNVPRMKMVTVQSVHKLALEHEVIASYLPDLEDLSAEWMPREFLFSIVHSLEPSFF